MIYFTSDLHFGHANVIRYESRPYRDVTEMNEALVDNWNQVVSSEDEVYVVGDFSMSKSMIIPFGSRLNGIKKIVPGNHDQCFNLSNKSQEKQINIINLYKSAGFEIMPEQMQLTLPSGIEVLVCHFPYRQVNDGNHAGYEPRYPDKRPHHQGQWLIHGHVHGRWRIREDVKCLNVSVEVHDYRPISIIEIDKIINKRK